MMRYTVCTNPMRRIFSILLILGVIVWGFLLWDRTRPDRRIETLVEQADNAETADRCAKYRVTDGGDESTWSLGYAGRIRQLVHWCF